MNPFWGLGATYAIHLRLIEKRAVDFLSVIIELFSLDVTAEAVRANIDCNLQIGVFAGTLSVWPKILNTRLSPPNILLVGKLDEYAFYMVYKFRQKFFGFIAIHTFVRRTEISLIIQPCIACKLRSKNGE